MKYYVVRVSNGNMTIASEWNNDLNGAKSAYHNDCRTLFNAPDVIRGIVAIVDEELNVVESKYKEIITHDAPTVEFTEEE